MVRYSQFSGDATSAEGKKLWEPLETLGIINTDPGYQRITCIGYAPSCRRRCRNPIRADNRDFIMDTLKDIAYLDPDSPAVATRLRAIAGPALCVRYHQSQSDTIVRQWQGKLQQLKSQMGEQRPTKPMPSSKKPEIVPDQSTEDWQQQFREMRELLAQLREELKSKEYQDQVFERRPEDRVTENQQEEERRRRSSEEKDREVRSRKKERLERERLEKERLEKERLEKERIEKEHIEKERLEEERLEKERLEKERLDKEKKEEEEKKRREREQTASNERIRQRAQKLREEREREKREREQKEREEWDQSWTKYQEQWVHFKASSSTENKFRDAIPWPVKSGSYQDVKASNVKEFLQSAMPTDSNKPKLLRKECQKWHPDMIDRLPLGAQLTDVDRMMIDMICRVVTGLLNDSAGRSAEFLD